MGKIKVLVCCEFSGVVREAFRNRGFEAYSLDILPSLDNSPFHIQDDIRNGHLNKDWTLMIAHPPCTYLAVSGNRWFNVKKYGDKAIERFKKMEEAIEFVKELWNAPIPHIAIENPVGRLSTKWEKPTQCIQPFEFGDPVSKKTCLWLKNLPKLTPTNVVPPEMVEVNGKRMSKFYYDTFRLPGNKRGQIRSITFRGIAEAMAEQWGNYLKSLYGDE